MARRPDIHEQLTAWLDGELDPAARRQVDDALAASAELRRELDELRATRELIAIWRPFSPC